MPLENGASRGFGRRGEIENDNSERSDHIVQQVADHYNARENRSQSQRQSSPIINMRKLNNWVKSVLLHKYVKKNDSVLDLACGKGGDLTKYANMQIGCYVGIDVANGSIEHARERYNGMLDVQGERGRRQPLSFPAKFVCADCFDVNLADHLSNEIPFDICSCQVRCIFFLLLNYIFLLQYLLFATHVYNQTFNEWVSMCNLLCTFLICQYSRPSIQHVESFTVFQFAFHYCFQNEERARQALKNISDTLKPGGYFVGTLPDANVIVSKLRNSNDLSFGNSCYNISFSSLFSSKRFPKSSPFGINYDFHLEDAVDCPEWLVPFPFIKELAKEYDLELEMNKNFHEFVCENVTDNEYAILMNRIVGPQGLSNINKDEWDAIYIYKVFAFKKSGREQKRKRDEYQTPSFIKKEDVLVL